MAQSFQELINGEKPVVVDFSAEWCGPCKMMAPVLKEAKDMVGETATIIKIDVDRNPAVAGSYNINSVPTLIIFKGGQIKWRKSGVVPAKLLVSEINKLV